MTDLPLPVPAAAPPRNRTLRRFLRHRLAVIGLGIIAVLTLVFLPVTGVSTVFSSPFFDVDF